MNCIKRLFNKKKRKEECDIPFVIKRFCVKYVVDGDLALEYSWCCNATSLTTAIYHFWDNHNALHHDIISINVC